MSKIVDFIKNHKAAVIGGGLTVGGVIAGLLIGNYASAEKVDEEAVETDGEVVEIENVSDESKE
jgi:hypothetical protein